MKIAVAGTGYVGLSLAVLLSKHNEVTAVDIVPEKVEKLNRWESPIQDEYIEKYLSDAKAGKRNLNLTATTDSVSAYREAELVVIAIPTNYDPQKNFFDTSAVEEVIKLVIEVNDHATMVIKSTITGIRRVLEKRWEARISCSVQNFSESPKLFTITFIRVGSL